MKLNNFSLFRGVMNRGASKTNMLSTMKQLSQYNQLSKGTMKKLYEKLDTVEISLASRQQQVTNQQAPQSITTLQGQKIQEIQAKNNVLEFTDGANYRFNYNGVAAVMKSYYHPSSSILGPAISDMGDHFGVEASSIFSSQDFKKVDKIAEFFSSLTSKSGLIGARYSYSSEEVLEMCKSVGIEPGWFTVKSSGESVKHYLRKDEKIFAERQVEDGCNAFMTNNLFDIGYKQGEKITIRETTYEVDETGHIQLPQDAPVFLSYNLDPVYSERQRLATIKENLTKAQQLKGEGQSLIRLNIAIRLIGMEI